MQTKRYETLLDTTTLSTDFGSKLFNIEDYKAFSIQIVLTDASSLNVTAKIQASLDGVTWSDDTDLTPATRTTNGPILFDNPVAGYPFTRVFLTFSAGSAKVKILAHAKQ